MGLFDKLFGKKASATAARSSGSTSLAGALMQQGDQLAPAVCDRCGTTTIASSSRVWLLSVREPHISLDVGGYCPRCHKTLCPRHLSYAHMVPQHLPVPPDLKNAAYGIACETCGTQVQGGVGGSPGGDITIVALDAEDLKPKRPKVAAHVAAPSGKFSLFKVLAGSMRDSGSTAEIPNLVCMRCFSLHPHPIPAISLGIDAFRQAGLDVTPADFEVDIGGNCPTCGEICGKHAVLKLITVNGTECLALHCAEHGSQLQ